MLQFLIDMEQLLSVGGAARIVGLSTQRLRALDAVLQPLRLETGARVYKRAAVEAYAQERAARKAAAR